MTSSRPGLIQDFVGTSINPARGPATSEMVWLDRYQDVVEVFRSKAFAQGSGGLRDSAPITGYGVLSLTGRDHFERRRLEASLFRRPNMLRLERDVLAPALASELAALNPGVDGVVRVDLLELLRSAYCDLTCAFWGIDGVDSTEQRRHFVTTVEAMLPGSVAEWAREHHREVVGQSLRAKREFEVTYFRPSMARRLALIKQMEAGELRDDELPADLLTVMLRAHEHFAQWDADVMVREMILFTPGDTITRLIPHMVDEIWSLVQRDVDQRRLLDEHSFLRACAIESLRLHPAVPFFVRTATTETTLTSGRSFAAGEYVVLDVRKASRDPEVFGPDSDNFDPHRTTLVPVKPGRLAFGDGPHTCIGMALSVGEAGHRGEDDADAPAGLVPITLRELFAAGVMPDSARKQEANVRNEFESFQVVFTGSPRTSGDEGSAS